MGVGVVLVHGACHGPWCWDKVVPLLEARGLRVATPDLYTGPSPSHPGVVQDAVDGLRVDGPVIVMGHSFGGYSITQLDPATVAHLVYLAAVLPDRESWFAGSPVNERFFEMVEITDGHMRTKPERARELFYADCSDADVAWAVAQLGTHPMDSLLASVDRPAWREVTTTYVCCDDDNTLTVDYMQAAIERVDHGVHLATSHSPMLSEPQRVADLVVRIAGDLARA